MPPDLPLYPPSWRGTGGGNVFPRPWWEGLGEGGELIQIFYRVYNKLGYGFLERIYENAMMIEFKRESIPAVSQSAIKVFYEDEIIGEYFTDILVDDKVIIENS